MSIKKWLEQNTSSLNGKVVAITGSTGGLGKELTKYISSLGASIIFLDRNMERSQKNKEDVVSLYPDADIKIIRTDLEDMSSVKKAVELLKNEGIDIFIHNAGAYSIPRHKTSVGYDNVFQINFVSPYYMIKELIPYLKERNGKVVVVGSIAHNYSKTDENDVDFSSRKKASLVYGNAKRYLMFSLFRLFENEEGVTLSVTHPGITFTNITAHYPKLIFAIIKHPMKVIFMKPKKAALSILKGLFDSCSNNEWIGPRVFDVWGYPRKHTLKTCKKEEADVICKRADEIYSKL